MSEIQPILSPEIQRLSIEAIDFARQARADSTLKAYRTDWRLFERFCQTHGLVALPADASTIALFITSLAEENRPSTIRRKLAALSVAHKAAGQTSPVASELVRSTMSGIRRAKGMTKKQKAPIRARHFREGLTTMRNDVKGIRDKAILLTAYAGALRRSELVGLDLADLVFTPEGVVLSIARSKTDQEGVGVKVAIKKGNRSETCPVNALRDWIATLESANGALFRSIRKGGLIGENRLSDKSVCTVFKEFAALLGLDPAQIGGHSGRSGVITDGFSVGVPQAVIAKHSRHRSNAIADYLREATLFDQNLSGLVGL
jgi:integrase